MEQGYELALNNIRKAALEESQPVELYIPLQGKYTTNSEEKPCDLAQKINEFFVFDDANRNDPRVMLLLGDTGSGKSVFSQHLYQKLWERFKAGDPIPLWIPLPELLNPFEGAVEEILKKYEFSESQIAEMKERERFIFLVDGYDELHRFQNCYVTNKWDKWNSKMLITCRSQAIYYQADPDKYFMPFNGEKRLPMLLRKLYVAPFSKEQIYTYVKQYQQLNTENKISEEDFSLVPGLTELITTPFLLHLTVEALPDIMANVGLKEENSKMTQAKLYDIFIERWFTRQVLKLKAAGQLKDSEQNTKQQFWDYCKRLAQRMHANDVTVIPYTLKKTGGRLFGKQEKKNSWEEFFSEETEILRSACPLKRMGEHHYGFIHASLVEYFATRAMYEEIQEQEDVAEIPVENKEKEEIITVVEITEKKPKGGIHHRVFAKEPNAIRNLADRIEMKEAFKQKMLKIVEQSKISQQYAIGAANAITALVKAGVTFNGADLRGIKIAGADISGGYFDQASLVDADLFNTQLSQVWMQKADLRSANMDDVNFGEYPWFMHEVLVGGVKSICYRPDINQLLTASGRKVMLWNIETGECVYTINELGGSDINCVSICNNGEVFASGSSDHNVRVWYVVKRNSKVLEGHRNSINCVCLNDDGNILVSGSDDATVRVWDVSNGQDTVLSGHEGGVFSVHLSANGKTVVSGSRDKTVRVWDLTSGMVVVLRGHAFNVNSVQISRDGKTVVSAGESSFYPRIEDNTVRLWDVSSGNAVILQGHKGTVTSVCLSEDGKTVVSGSHDCTIRVWDVTTRLSVVLQGHKSAVHCVSLSPDGKTVASGSEDKTVRIWDMAVGQKVLQKRGHEAQVYSVCLSSDGKKLVSGSLDKTVRVWDLNDGSMIILNGHENTVNSVFMSADNNTVVSGGTIRFGNDDPTLIVWNVAKERSMRLHKLKESVECVYVNSNGKTVFYAGSRNIYSMDVETGKILKLRKFQSSASCVHMSANEKKIVYGGEDGNVPTICVSDVNGENEISLIGHNGSIKCVFINSDGTIVVSGSVDKTIRIWDVLSGKFVLLQGHEVAVNCVYLSEDEKTVVSCSGNNAYIKDYTVRLWDIESLSQKAIIYFNSPVRSISVQYSLGLIVTGLEDGSLQLWQKMDDSGQKWLFKWSSTFPNSNTVLTLTNCDLRNSKGLSSMNYRLLKQRGAVVDTNPASNTVRISSDLITQVASCSGSPLHQNDSELPDSMSDNTINNI